ncbi:hypothetical protein EDC94DRAFT_599293 [Helicostylum pulchrum]|nr:hypothetical protein EDC94DRAFT_599293 [Helicostylum pulchrum]
MTGVATCDSIVKKPDDIEQPALKNAAWVGTSEGTQTGEDEGNAAATAGWDPTQTQIQAEKDKERLPLPWEEVYAKGFVPFDGNTTVPSWRILHSQTELQDEPEQVSVKVLHDTGSAQGQSAVHTASESQMSSKDKTTVAQDKSRSDCPVSAIGDGEAKTADVKETQAEKKPEQTPEQAMIQAKESTKERAKEQAVATKLTTE